MIKSYSLNGLLALMFFLTCSAQLSAEQITIFGNYNKPPKYYLQGNEPKGILIEIMKYVDEKLPQDFSYKLYPWKRSYQKALSGQGGIIGLSKTTERLEIFDYSDVMFYDELVLVVLSRNEFEYHDISDLKGKNVGVPLGSSYGDKFEKAKNILFYADVDIAAEQRLLKLLSGRIDVALIGPGKAGLNRTIEQNEELVANRDKFVVLETPFKRDPNYLGFSKKLKMNRFLEVFNQVIKTGIQNGEIQKIIENAVLE